MQDTCAQSLELLLLIRHVQHRACTVGHALLAIKMAVEPWMLSMPDLQKGWTEMRQNCLTLRTQQCSLYSLSLDCAVQRLLSCFLHQPCNRPVSGVLALCNSQDALLTGSVTVHLVEFSVSLLCGANSVICSFPRVLTRSW